MTDGSPIDVATKRLAFALDALEAALERRREADRSEAALADQLQAAGIDRARLAADLDTQTARVKQLEQANREIARRLDIAMESIRAVLAAHDH